MSKIISMIGSYICLRDCSAMGKRLFETQAALLQSRSPALDYYAYADNQVSAPLPSACLKLPDTNALCPFRTHRAWFSGFFSIRRRQKRWCLTSWECMVTWLKIFHSWGLLTFSITITLQEQEANEREECRNQEESKPLVLSPKEEKQSFLYSERSCSLENTVKLAFLYLVLDFEKHLLI